MSYKTYNYTNLGYTLTHAPYSIHLIAQSPQENPTKIYYVSADNQKELWIYTIATHSDELKETRDHKIQSIFHDSANSKIYGVDCDNDGTGDDFDIWYINTTTDAITEVGTSSGAPANTVLAYDIFKIGTDIYAIDWEKDPGVALPTKYLICWNVTAAPFVEEDRHICSQPAGGDILYYYKGLVNGDWYYAIFTRGNGVGAVGFAQLSFDSSTSTLESLIDWDSVSNYEKATAANMYGCAFDNVNTIYFIANKIADGLNYLCYYEIGIEESFVVVAEYNVSLMLDRNCSGVSPNFQEKGFDISLDANNCAKIYQISKGRGNLLAIAQLQLGAGDSIVAVTDSYLIVNDSGTIELYQYVDFMSYIGPRSVIKARQRNFWTCELYVYKTGDLGDFLIFDGMWVTIIGPLTSAGSTENNAVVFEGYLKFSKLLNPRKCTVDSPALFNLRTRLTADTYNGRTDEIIVDIITVDAPNIAANDMDAGAAMGDYIVKGSKTLLTQLNTFAQQDAFTWVLFPDQGRLLLNYNDGTVDSGVDIAETDDISEVDGTKQRDIINQVTVKGAINPATGVPYTGTYNDTASQKIYGIQPIYRHFAGLASDALCLAQATSICTIQQQVPFRYTFRKDIGAEGLVLPTETITFAYSLGETPVASGQRIISELAFYFRAGVCYWTVEDALSFTSELELLYQEVEENSDLIEQLAARIVAIISDAAFGAGWDGVTGIAASKNAIYDAFKINGTEKVCRVAVGTYTGDATNNREITVGFAVKGVLLTRRQDGSNMYTSFQTTDFTSWESARMDGGLFANRLDIDAHSTTSGFEVNNNEASDCENILNKPYYWIVWG